MQLSEVQKRFTETMLDHPKVLDDPPADLAAVFQTGNIPLSSRLKVYRNNIVGSLTDVMSASFPVILKLVGKEFFEGMARSFILKHPPHQGCLNFYGSEFAAFIEGFEPAASLPYLPDVARLEIAMNDAYYARDDEPLRPDALAAVAPEDLAGAGLRLRHAAQLLKSSYPLHDIRAFALSEKQDGQLDINKGGVYLMIDRAHLDSRIVVLGADEFMMLSALGDGEKLGEAVETTIKAYPDFDFAAFLQKHIALETFSSLCTNKAS